MIFIGAKNEHLTAQDGRRYYDLTSGWNVTNAGWNNSVIFKDWMELLEPLPFRPSWCSDANQALLTRELNSYFPSHFPIFSCTGSEAVDNALKLARLATGKGSVACLKDAYHGSTLGASLATGYEVSHQQPLGMQARRFILPPPTTSDALHEIRQILTRETDIGAVVFETVLTNANCHTVPDAFLDLIGELSERLGFLLVCDEIGTGMNRTGHLLSINGHAIRPHIITCGKALTNGLYPLSVALVSLDLKGFVEESSFASTFGGTSAACSAALITLRYHRAEDLGARASMLGSAVRARFEEMGHRFGLPLSIRGTGLALAVGLQDEQGFMLWPGRPSRLVDFLKEQSIFASLSPDGSHLMISPPLTANVEALLDAVDIVCKTIFNLRIA